MEKLKDGMVRVSIPVNKMLSDLRIPFDVIAMENGETKLLFRKWTLITEEIHAKLRGEGIQSVFIEGDPNYIKEYLEATGLDETVSALFDGDLAFEESKLGFHEMERSLVIDKDLIPVGAMVRFSIYEIADQSINLILIASAEKPATITALSVQAKGPLLIPESDIPQYQNYLSELSLQGGTIGRRIKGICLRENAKIVARKYVTKVSHSFDLESITQTSDQIVESLYSGEVLLSDVYSQQIHGCFSYTHAVNVCALSVGFALKLKRDENFARKLGLGSLLHDIGKLGLPKEVALKQGEITNDEYAILKKHPAEGVRMLAQVQGVPQEVLLVVLQHHKRLNGNGYPLGNKTEKLSRYGQLAAIANCFDALTSSRPHRYALSPSSAAFTILNEARDFREFDTTDAKVFTVMVHDMLKELPQ